MEILVITKKKKTMKEMKFKVGDEKIMWQVLLYRKDR